MKRIGTSRSRTLFRAPSLGLLGPALFLAGQLHAQLSDLQPATFGPFSGLADLGIEPEDLGSADSLAVRCQAFVETDGSLTENLCTSDDGIRDRRIIARVADSVAAESFSPARVDGREVRVLMNFSVLITCAGGECASVPVPNHAYQIGAFGLDYVAPQAIVSGKRWYEGFEDRGPRFRSPAVVRPNSAGVPTGWFTAAVDVDSEGVATASCIYALDRVDRDDVRQRNRRRLESILGNLVETRYVPGFNDGAPVPMRFFESNNVRVQLLPGNGAQAFVTAREAPELYCDR